MASYPLLDVMASSSSLLSAYLSFPSLSSTTIDRFFKEADGGP